MKALGWVIGVGLGVLLGLVISLMLNGTSGLNLRVDGNPNRAEELLTLTQETPLQKTTPGPTPVSIATLSEIDSDKLAQPTAISPMIEPGDEKQDDLQDVLLLYDSANLTNFATNFCKIAEFYGLRCKKVDLRSNLLTDWILRDAQGGYFRLVGLDAPALLQQPSLLKDEEITSLKNAVENIGVNLLVAKVIGNPNTDATFLRELTDGAILGVANFKQAKYDWIVSGDVPELTREFTGQVIVPASTTSISGSALLVNQSSITPIISALDSTGATLPVFVRWKKGVGAIYVDSGQPAASLDRVGLADLYYNPASFSQIVSLMMTIQATMGEETWHSKRHFANLTIDNATLLEPFQNLSFVGLLREMLVHNFHTTIAYIPAHWEETTAEVVRLFKSYPEMFSIVQKGNNSDGYEFYHYEGSINDQKPEYPARSFTDQEWDIMEGLARMELLSSSTGLPYERVMIFPGDISPAQTLKLLKKQDYLASVNEQDIPLGSARPTDWDYGMYPATLNYEGFSLLTRRFVDAESSANGLIQQSAFDLFLNKPILFFGFADKEGPFADGVGGFNPIADRVNLLQGGVDWHSLGTIVKSLYLEKTNDDGSIDIRMYGGTLILRNEAIVERNYHITKEETSNMPISSLTVNGQPFSYEINDDQLAFSLKIPAKSSVEIQIHYLEQ